MTLALGADSYLRQWSDGQDGIFLDPVGRTCLKDFIDVIVNSEECFLTLPSDFEYVSLPPLIKRLTNLKQLPNCAGIQLKESVEVRIFNAFWETLKSLGHDWISQWFKSQFWNPIVTRHHQGRLGTTARKFKTITDEGWECWNRLIPQSQLTNVMPLAIRMPDEEYLKEEIHNAKDSLVNFQYCYAYDVFRRGWQYAEAARQRNLEISYCPHQFRRRALDGGSDGWLEAAREIFWSWGQCIVNAVDTAPKPVAVELVADWIHGLLAAKVPRWIDVPDLVAMTEEDERAAHDLIEKLHEIALSAGIPLSKLHLGADRLLERIESGMSDISFQVLGAGEVMDLDILNTAVEPPAKFRKMSRPRLMHGWPTPVTARERAVRTAPERVRESSRVLQVLRYMANNIERNPHAFRLLGEEDIRGHFLGYLNGHYGGQAHGESFNAAGKTDLLIRVNDKNVFIVECKFWRGPKSLLQTFDQLLSYLTWHDTQAALLIFHRGKNFSNVLAKIVANIPKHKHFSSELEQVGETTFQHYFRYPTDAKRKILITTVAFLLPSAQS